MPGPAGQACAPRTHPVRAAPSSPWGRAEPRPQLQRGESLVQGTQPLLTGSSEVIPGPCGCAGCSPGGRSVYLCVPTRGSGHCRIGKEPLRSVSLKEESDRPTPGESGTARVWGRGREAAEPGGRGTWDPGARESGQSCQLRHTSPAAASLMKGSRKAAWRRCHWS